MENVDSKFMNFINYCGLSAAIFLLSSLPVLAQQPINFFDILKETESLLIVSPNDPQLHFIKGMALSQLGKYQESNDEFRWLLAYDPKQIRPRLEFALNLVKLKQFESAKYHFEQILSEDIPISLRKNIENIIYDIRQHKASLTLSIDFVNDSNPGQATSKSEIEIQGLKYRVNNDARLNSSAGVKLGYDGKVPLSNDAWFIRLTGEKHQYAEDRYNFDYAHASIGKHEKISDQILTIELGKHYSEFGHEKLFDGSTLSAQVFKQFSPTIGISYGAYINDYQYQDYYYMSGTQPGVSVNGVYAPEIHRRFILQTNFAHHMANETPYAYQQKTLHIKYIHEWNAGWVTIFGTILNAIDYQDTDPMFLKTRSDFDKRYEIEVLNRKYRILNFTPQIKIGGLTRETNIEFYEYSRSYIQIGIIGDF